MDLLETVIQPYAWGSRTAIAELQGRPSPTVSPEAELWMGAHPSGPSGVRRAGASRTTLDAVIAADPVGELGGPVAERFGGRLPFLLKVLAAEKALSIQVHPSREQAEAGYRAENERGLAVGATSRNYVDDWPKPEILCALTPFEALAGMRTTDDAAALLRALGVAELEPLAARLAAADGPAALSEALGEILAWPPESRASVVAAVAAACERVAVKGGAYPGAYAADAAAYAKVAIDHPGDIGLLAALLLRYTVLTPGQAVFLPADGLHAYLRGTGVELMASSDNVLRAGLTPKHIDIPELLALADPAAIVPVLEPTALGDGVSEYDTPAPEFRLYRADLGGGSGGSGEAGGAGGSGGVGGVGGEAGAAVTLPGAGGPRVVLCAEGSAELRAGEAALKVGRGESAFLPAADGEVTAAGQAVLFIAANGS